MSKQIKKILLIDVENDLDTNESGQLQTRWTHHPLGLMYLSSYAQREIPGLDIRIFHTVTVSDLKSHLQKLLRDFQPDMVGLRALSLFQKQFSLIASVVREHSPQSILMGGGPYVSASYNDILKKGLIDVAVIEEGEITFIELIKHYTETNAKPLNLAGTAILLDDDEVKLNSKRPLIQDLDSIPYPDYSKINLSDYAGLSNHAFQSADKCAFIYSSRGCPYRCYYCHEALVKTVRRRSPENVFKEMKQHYHERGLRNFVFVDDIFNVPKRTGKAILKQVIDKMPGVSLNFPNGLRADQLDDEFLDLLEEAGTVHMALAVETASPRVQKVVGKNLKIERARYMIDNASKRFITCVFFMMGFPSETKEEVRETIAFASELKHLVQPVMSVVRVYPGLPLYDALFPSEEQKLQIETQTSEAMQPKLFDKTPFYGDLFPDSVVPLSGEDVQGLRWEWVRKVIQDQERIKNSHKILEKFFNESQIIEFYRNFFDKPKFTQKDLDFLLKTSNL